MLRSLASRLGVQGFRFDKVFNEGAPQRYFYKSVLDPSFKNDDSLSLTFKIATDKAYGGRSTASFRDGVFAGELVPSNTGGKVGLAGMIAHFKDDDERADVLDYEALGMRIRADGRPFSVNLTPDSYIGPGVIYQGYLVGYPKNEWFEAKIFFDQMLMTQRGLVNEFQQAFDTPRVKAIGFNVGIPPIPGTKESDHVPGPFQLEIQALWWSRGGRTDGKFEKPFPKPNEPDAAAKKDASSG